MENIKLRIKGLVYWVLYLQGKLNTRIISNANFYEYLKFKTH